jgi:hypothetical protein
VIGADIQNTTRPDLKPATATPASVKRELLKQVVVDRLKRSVPRG